MKKPNLVQVLRRALAPIKRQIRTSIVRGISKITKEGLKLQLIQVESFEDDVKDDVEKFQEFGFKSYAPNGSEVIMLSVAGSNEHFVVLSSENRAVLKTLPELEEGDSIFYNKNEKYIHMKGDNIESKVDKFKIENDTAEFVSKLSEILKKLRDSKWNTAIGPQPIFAADKADLDGLIAELDSFKI